MKNKIKVVSLEDRVPKLKQHRKKKANRRLLFLLTLFLVLILSVLYFQSSFSRVHSVDVTGNELIQKDEIITISGIKKGDNVWGINRNEVKSILEKEAEIQSAKVKLIFPNKIVLHIEEFKKEAYLVDESNFYVILSNGKVLAQPESTMTPVDAPLLRGFKEDATLESMIEQLNELPEEVQNLISEIILQPKNTDPLHITLFMNDGYEVSATIRTFSEKMVHYPSIVSQIDPSKKGIIDLEVGSYFRAYETEGEEDEKEESER